MKKIYLSVLFSILLIGANAQNFNWAKVEGLWAYDYGYGVATDVSGNVYCTGKYELNADFSGTILPCQNNHDMFLVQYDPNGNLNWIRTAGGPGGDYAQSIACDGSNYLYVAGEIEGWGDQVIFPGSTETLTVKGDNDLFLAKYALDGTLIWARSAGGWHNEKALGVAYDQQGNVYVCGLYTDTCYFNLDTIVYNYGNSSRDIFLAKYDANGNFQWVRTAGSGGRDEAKSVICDASGNVYICGFYSNGCQFGSQTLWSANGYYDSFVAKFNTNGDLQWVTTGGGNYDEVAWGITIDNAGLIYIAGEFNASAFFGSTQLITGGNADVLVACYDQSGNTLWARRGGGPLIDRARGIGTDGNNIYITGQFGSYASFGAFGVNAADSSDVFIASLDNTGNFLTATSITGPADSVETLGYESGISVCAETGGTVYATGGLLNGGTFGSTTPSYYKRTDVFVAKLSQFPLAAAPAKPARGPLFPNPCDGVFTIEVPKPIDQAEVVIYNYLGVTVNKSAYDTFSTSQIDLAQHAAGVYIVEMKTADKSLWREKLVIQK